MENDKERPLAFVIMPYTHEFTGHYTNIIKPALEEAGYEVSRADTDLDQQNILRKIIKGITRAKLIVAELTTLNPNVLYELGLSHGLGAPTVILAQSIEEVPFDLRSYDVQIYSTHYIEVKKLKEKLKEIGARHLSGELNFGNPVTDFAPERRPSGIEGRINNTKVPWRQGDDMQDREQGGILEATQASQELAKVMVAIVEEINNSVNKVSPLLASLDEAIHDPAPGKNIRAKKLAEEIASELDQSSARIEDYLPRIEGNIKAPFQVLFRYLTVLDPEVDQSNEQLHTFRDMFEELSGKVPLALKGLKSYGNSVEQIGLRSAIMGPASHRNKQAVESITYGMEQIHAFISRAIQVIDERTNTN